jgi:hypothetical protein
VSPGDDLPSAPSPTGNSTSFRRSSAALDATEHPGFHLRQQDGWTRLIVRGIGGAFGHSWFDVPHFVMEQKMMRGIRDRAEKTRRERTTAFISEEYRSIQQEQRSGPVGTVSLVK